VSKPSTEHLSQVSESRGTVTAPSLNCSKGTARRACNSTHQTAQELKEMRGSPGDQYPLESSERFAKWDECDGSFTSELRGQ